MRRYVYVCTFIVVLTAGVIFLRSLGSDRSFLQHETLALPTNNTLVKTAKPLRPYRPYMVRLNSPHDLEPLRADTEFSSMVHLVGARAQPVKVGRGLRNVVNELVFIEQGTGESLTLQLVPRGGDELPDLGTAAIRVEVYPWPWWRDKAHGGLRFAWLVPVCLAAALPLFGIFFGIGEYVGRRVAHE